MRIDWKIIVLAVTVLVCSTAVLCASMLRAREPSPRSRFIYEKVRHGADNEVILKIDRDTDEIHQIPPPKPQK